MSLGEFEIIDKYFRSFSTGDEYTVTGIGDDAAQLKMPSDQDFVTTSVNLVEDIHFESREDPAITGYSILVKALTQLAVTGAQPKWMTLSLQLPHIDEAWLHAFSTGLKKLAQVYSIQLLGGDTTRGKTCITLHLHGMISQNVSSHNDQTREGDLIYVTGTLGDSGLSILARYNEVKMGGKDLSSLLARDHYPEPRTQLTSIIRTLAGSIISLPQGLAHDLFNHLQQYGLGATLYSEQLPISELLQQYFEPAGGWLLPLTSSEKTELCFTISPEQQTDLNQRLQQSDTPCTWIGIVEKLKGVRAITGNGEALYTLP